MEFFTSDTHFGHAKIIDYNKRPFSNVEEMDETIINNYNSVVSSNDIVYHLGDFAFRDFYQYRKRLNGNIVLIKGNHDYARLKPRHYNMFKSVHDILELKLNGESIMLCHYAMRTWNKSHFNAWHCYGHSHGRLEGQGKSCDVGVDANNYTPISFLQLKLIMENSSDNPNYLKRLKGYNQKEFDDVKKLVDDGIEVD